MSEASIGYARCSTDEQDRTAQRQRLAELRVADERVYLDHGRTDTTRSRPDPDQTLAAAVDLCEPESRRTWSSLVPRARRAATSSSFRPNSNASSCALPTAGPVEMDNCRA